MTTTTFLLFVVGILLVLFGSRSFETEPERIEVVIPRRRSGNSGCAMVLLLLALILVLITMSA